MDEEAGGAGDVVGAANVPTWMTRLINDYMEDIVGGNTHIQLLQDGCRKAVWRTCVMLGVDESGIPGQACRLLELFLSIYIRQNVVELSRDVRRLLQFKQKLMAETALMMFSCVQLAAKMSSVRFLLHPRHLQDIMSRYLGLTVSVGDIIRSEFKVFSTLGFRVPVWTSSEAAQMLALYCGLPMALMKAIEAVVNITELYRWKLNQIISGVGDAERSFSVSRIRTLHLVGGAISACARYFEFIGVDPIPMLAQLTLAPESYLRCIADVILFTVIADDDWIEPNDSNRL